MASLPDENSPPRLDPLGKKKRQSVLLDSPSRVTRSLSRRLSGAPIEAPMSPKPSVGRRRSVMVSESSHDAASQDDASSIQEEPVPRTRRSTRRSFAESVDDGSLSTRGTKLSSIEEVSKPVTRRTRSSLKPPAEADFETNLPVARRTRRSSVSSVTSSNASPMRRTRSQKNLSPVPSPTFSEASALSEIPEVSPDIKKQSSLPGKSNEQSSSNVTPVSSPSKNSLIKSAGSGKILRSSPTEGSSPVTKNRTSLSTPRQLQIQIADCRFSPDNKAFEAKTSPSLLGADCLTNEDTADVKTRRSRGRRSSSSKFVETPFEGSPKKILSEGLNELSTIVKNSEDLDSKQEQSGPTEVNISQRRPSGRSSLTKFAVSDKPDGDSKRLSLTASPASRKLSRESMGQKSVSSDEIAKMGKSPKDPSKRFSLSSPNSSALERSHRNSTGRQSVSGESPEKEKSFSLALVKSPVLERSRRDSAGRQSVSADESPEKEKSFKDTSGRFSVSSVKSLKLERSHTGSTGRESLSPSKSSEHEEFQENAAETQLLSCQLGKSPKDIKRQSLTSVKSTPLEKIQRSSISRMSSSSENSPHSKFNNSLQTLSSESRSSLGSSASIIHSNRNEDLAMKAADSTLMFSAIDDEQSMKSRRSSGTPVKSPGSSLKFNANPVLSELISDAVESNEASDNETDTVTSTSLLIPDSTTCRASTGNLAFGEIKRLSSSGSPVVKGLMTFNDVLSKSKEAMSESLNSSDTSNDSTSNDKPDEDQLSPVKQDHTGLKRLPQTPSSSDESFIDPNDNPLEKSSMFIEVNESFDSESTPAKANEKCLVTHQSPQITSPIKDDAESNAPESGSEVLIVPVNDSGDEVEVISKKITKSKPARHSDVVYRDAAVMLNGSGDYDSDAEDNQLELILPSTTNSKKELRMQKKLQRKAEKEARKKAKTDRVAVYNQISKKKLDKRAGGHPKPGNTDTSGSASFEENRNEFLSNLPEAHQGRKSTSLIVAPASSPTSGDINEPDGSHQVDQLSDDKSAKVIDAEVDNSFKNKKRLSSSDKVHTERGVLQSLPESSIVTGLASGSPKKLKVNEQKTAGGTGFKPDLPNAGEKKKKKKNKLIEGIAHKDGLGNTFFEEKLGESEETTENEPVTKKKQLKRVVGNATEEVKHKRKNEQKANNTELEPFAKDYDDVSDNIMPYPLQKKEKNLKCSDKSELVKKKKKKRLQDCTNTDIVALKKKKIDQNMDEETVTDQLFESDVTTKEAKKKTKRAETGNVLPESSGFQTNALSETNYVQVEKVKKKKKRIETDNALTKTSGIQNNAFAKSTDVQLDNVKRKKERHETGLEMPSAVDNESNEHSVIPRKKKNKKKMTDSSSMKMTECGHGSDSDDAPTSVSFATGKKAANAELQAAANHVRKQQELKAQKTKLQQDRRREEKLAKAKRMQQSREHVDQGDISTKHGDFNNYLSSKIDPGKSSGHLKTELKPPKRLAPDLLELLSEQPPTKSMKGPDGSKEKVVATTLSSDKEKQIEKRKAKKLAKKLQRKNLLESDYIPLDGVLGSTRFGVVPLRNVMLAKKIEKTKLAEASNFRQQSLFGNRIRRTPVSSLLSTKEKLKASEKDQYT